MFGLEQVQLEREGVSVFMFGKEYTSIDQHAPSDLEFSSLVENNFFSDFYKVIWVTYRSEFKPIDLNDFQGKRRVFTSDVGWGCTVRVAQMLLLNTIKRHAGVPESEILEMIQENKVDSPYSIHSFCAKGEEFEKVAGDWYSPACVSHIVSRLLKARPIANLLCKVVVDSVIFKDEVRSLVSSNEQNVWAKSLFLIIPLMLGLNRIQPEYYSFLKFILEMKECMGIVGGKPRSALYIIGYQQNNLLILDPHLVRKSCRNRQEVVRTLYEHHCETPKLLPMAKAESSLAIGFYFAGSTEFAAFESRIRDFPEFTQGLLSIRDETPPSPRSNISLDAESDEDFMFL